MSSNLMSTEVGGEQTQYESVDTFQKSHKKSGGQLGSPETTTDPANTNEARQQMAERGERTAENIRYGQAISEQGMGGTTTDQTGQAADGNSVDSSGLKEGGAQQRRAQGYGGERDMDQNIGS